MPAAPTMRARVDQVLQWLEEFYPCAFTVRLAWLNKLKWESYASAEECRTLLASERRMGIGAVTYKPPGSAALEILLSRLAIRTRHEAIETLLHEWAHALVWTYREVDRVEHRDEWGLAYARIYSAYHDEHGCIDSRTYKWRVR